jgi:quercetin dioxygenase-like cupin family protein
MNIIDVSSAPQHPNPHNADVKKLYYSELAQSMHIMLKPGQAIKKHITPVDVFFYVLEGKGIVEIGDEKQEVGPNTLIESPAKIAHCWYNESDAVFRVLVVKVPRPTESTKLL